MAEVTGQRFGRLVVVGRTLPNKWRHPQVECRCDCGKTTIVVTMSLRQGRTRSCGCLDLETKTTHGHAGKGRESRTYRTWKAMHNRCYDPKHPAFKTYSLLGVTKPWRDSFRTFLEDMGERPDGRTLDRIDNRFGYFTANCRWATPKEQANNRRTNKQVEQTHG